MPEMPRRPYKRCSRPAGLGAREDGGRGEDAVQPQPKRPRKQRDYIPAYRSGPYALLLALYEAQLEYGAQVGGIMTKQQLIDVAQKYCDASFTAPSDPRKCYTAWSGMKVLTEKDLVWERGNPKKYSLSDVGEVVAQGIMAVERAKETAQEVRGVDGEEDLMGLEPRVGVEAPGGEGAKGKRKRNGNGNGKGKLKNKGKERGKVNAPRKGKSKETDAIPAKPLVRPLQPLSIPLCPESDIDANITLDSSEWLQFVGNPPILGTAPQQSSGLSTLGNSTLNTTSTVNASCSSISNTLIDVEDDGLTLFGSGPSGNVAPSSSPPLTPRWRSAKPSLNPGLMNEPSVLDLTRSSPPLSPTSPALVPQLPISPLKPLSARDPNQPTDLRRPLSRSTSQQHLVGPSKTATAPSTTATFPSSSHFLLKENQQQCSTDAIEPALTTARASSTVPAQTEATAPTFPPFSPSPYTPGTFTIHLVLDSREVRCKSDRTYLQTELASKGVHVLTRPLHIGDALWIARHEDSGTEIVLDFIIERKRMDDLVGSIKDGRFHEQKWRLTRSGVKNIIYLIEDLGNWVPGGGNSGGGADSGMRDAINTAISSTQIVNGFFVKRTSKMDDTIRYLSRMHTHLTKLYSTQTLYPIPSQLLSSHTYTSDLLPHLSLTHPTCTFYPEYTAFNEMVDKSAQLTTRDVFLKMLMCIRGVSAEKAIEIQRVWQTPGELLEAYSKCKGGVERKELVMKGVGDRGVGRKRIGKALSEKVMEIWWGEEG